MASGNRLVRARSACAAASTASGKFQLKAREVDRPSDLNSHLGQRLLDLLQNRDPEFEALHACEQPIYPRHRRVVAEELIEARRLEDAVRVGSGQRLPGISEEWSKVELLVEDRIVGIVAPRLPCEGAAY